MFQVVLMKNARCPAATCCSTASWDCAALIVTARGALVVLLQGKRSLQLPKLVHGLAPRAAHKTNFEKNDEAATLASMEWPLPPRTGTMIGVVVTVHQAVTDMVHGGIIGVGIPT